MGPEEDTLVKNDFHWASAEERPDYYLVLTEFWGLILPVHLLFPQPFPHPHLDCLLSQSQASVVDLVWSPLLDGLWWARCFSTTVL